MIIRPYEASPAQWSYMMLVRCCTRCLYAAVHDACTLLYTMLVRCCTRCLYAAVHDVCTLLYTMLVRYCTRCLYATVQDARTGKVSKSGLSGRHGYTPNPSQIICVTHKASVASPTKQALHHPQSKRCDATPFSLPVSDLRGTNLSPRVSFDQTLPGSTKSRRRL